MAVQCCARSGFDGELGARGTRAAREGAGPCLASHLWRGELFSPWDVAPGLQQPPWGGACHSLLFVWLEDVRKWDGVPS